MLKKKFVKLSFFIVILFSFSFAPGCAGTVEIPPEVCEYGDTILDIAETLVEMFPNVPPIITTYIELARANLAILCETEPGTTLYNKSIKALAEVNDSLRIAVDEFKQSLKNQTLDKQK